VFAQELARRLEGTGKQHFPILWVFYSRYPHLKH
jgi:hypothetical protein